MRPVRWLLALAAVLILAGFIISVVGWATGKTITVTRTVPGPTVTRTVPGPAVTVTVPARTVIVPGPEVTVTVTARPSPLPAGRA